VQNTPTLASTAHAANVGEDVFGLDTIAAISDAQTAPEKVTFFVVRSTHVICGMARRTIASAARSGAWVSLYMLLFGGMVSPMKTSDV
jgi:hypothetical protein